MEKIFLIQSNNTELLQKAKRIAINCAEELKTNETVGILFLGAIARGYFDNEADIDIAIFVNNFPQKYKMKNSRIEGFTVQCFIMDYQTEKDSEWDMGKRWAYSINNIFYDYNNMVKMLIEEKTKILEEEKKMLLMSGIVLSEWYINRLTEIWIKRGDILSAHYMINEGLNWFFTALYVYNNELVADFKWRIYCLRFLKELPQKFSESLNNILLTKEISEEEIKRRKLVFMELWSNFLPKIEKYLNMKFEEIRDLV